jgi:general secretion pathway protein G
VRLRDERGVTLIEMMLVIIIIGILVAMVVPRLTGRSEQARVAAAKADIEANLAVALDLYELDNGVYPTTEQGLDALLEEPSIEPIPPAWNGPYLKRRLPKDPWGEAYVYRCPGLHNTKDYDLLSRGPDHVEGSSDDIVNWDQ